ncbi:unnamed protein product [Pleuronectes platessa]|uniref:Uncharacterized protein n=1 Tax=Pleuronectes platessa TaxID=8262 RepID=A0A9N7ZA27_PLEPL|nr:unnamed protein product [Pleuronectes platessa]
MGRIIPAYFTSRVPGLELARGPLSPNRWKWAEERTSGESERRRRYAQTARRSQGKSELWATDLTRSNREIRLFLGSPPVLNTAPWRQVWVVQSRGSAPWSFLRTGPILCFSPLLPPPRTASCGTHSAAAAGYTISHGNRTCTARDRLMSPHRAPPGSLSSLTADRSPPLLAS